VSGTGVLLWGTSPGGTFEGYQVGISGSDPTKVSFQTFSPGPGWHQYDLGFDASEAFHAYTISYTNIYELFVDGKQLLATSTASILPLQMEVQYQYSTQYYGPFTATPPIHAYAMSASWVTANGGKAVCSSPEDSRVKVV